MEFVVLSNYLQTKAGAYYSCAYCYVVFINCVVKQDPFFDVIRHGETEMEDIRYHINIFLFSPLSALKDVF